MNNNRKVKRERVDKNLIMYGLSFEDHQMSVYTGTNHNIKLTGMEVNQHREFEVTCASRSSSQALCPSDFILSRVNSMVIRNMAQVSPHNDFIT